MTREPLDALIAEVIRSSKYRHVAPELIGRIGQRELRHRPLREAIKASKAKLHQVAGAYLPRKKYAEWLELLRRSKAAGEAEFRLACRAVMQEHTSTRERVPILERVFRETLQPLVPVRSIIDLGCGLNPLAVPWMPLVADTRYCAVDVHADLVAFLNGAFPLLGVEGEAVASDALGFDYGDRRDVAFLLKLLPCLQQIEPGGAKRLMEMVQADHFIVSFPVHSLGGRSKGMRTNYDAFLREIVGSGTLRRFDYATELVFVIDR